MSLKNLTRIAGAALVAGAVATALPAQAKKLKWDMASTYPSKLTQLGSLGKVLVERLDLVSGGEIKLTYQEPGALVPAFEVFDAVSSGAVQSAWSTPGYWTGKNSALALFAAVPFGPRASEYYAWIKFGGGQDMLDEIYAPHGIKSQICGVIAPEASGWFRKEINSIEDMKGMKMRFFGLGAKVMEKIGVSTQLLPGADIYPALELGSIDATEFSMPAIDLNLGFYQVAKHYYFPGWHQQSTLFELMINLDEWNGMSDQQRATFETVCDANFAYGLAEGEAIQFSAIKELKSKGVNIHQWSPEILATFKEKWDEVVAEEVAGNKDFARVWASLSAFRADYATWKELGYLK